MKKITAMVLALIMVMCSFTIISAADGTEEMRAVWMASVYNLDFPSEKNNAEAQKAEFSAKLDELKKIGVNTVIVQVRPKGDALYNSEINPWSDVLTGTQGKYPGYDPLEYMLEEAHVRGMEFHAWLNPYRVTTSGTDVTKLSETHPARVNPDWVLSYNNALFYNPEMDEVKQHICDTVAEIVKNYDVDAIHFDDYFYPSGYPLSAGEDKDGVEANRRRQNINDMVRMVYNTIKRIDSSVIFGISPVGIWKNEPTGAWGSVINGNAAYYSLYADAVTWIKNGWIDYVTPQIYWEIGNKAADYQTLVRWWANTVSGTNVKLYIGEGIYKSAIASEISEHIRFCRGISGVSGNMFYNYSSLSECKNAIKELYANTSTSDNGTSVKLEVVPIQTKALVNNSPVDLGAYNINGYNYFKLRDLAAALMNTGAEFSMEWKAESSTIVLLTNTGYSLSGGELSKSTGNYKVLMPSTAKLMLAGKILDVEAYNIDGNNYYKLRDTADAIGFNVSWRESDSTVIITAGEKN